MPSAVKRNRSSTRMPCSLTVCKFAIVSLSLTLLSHLPHYMESVRRWRRSKCSLELNSKRPGTWEKFWLQVAWCYRPAIQQIDSEDQRRKIPSLCCWLPGSEIHCRLLNDSHIVKNNEKYSLQDFMRDVRCWCFPGSKQEDHPPRALE